MCDARRRLALLWATIAVPAWVPALALASVLGMPLPGCASTMAVGRGGPVYEVRVATLNGTPTANRGPVAHPACVLQVGNQVAQVWLANASNQDHESPAVLVADAVALKDGILVERSWNEAIVHHVTDDELAAGAAVVYVPSARHLTTVELRFSLKLPISPISPTAGAGHSDQDHDLAKRASGLEQAVRGGDLP
jgi:hypothetical protein